MPESKPAPTPGLREADIRPQTALEGQVAAFARDMERLLARRAEFVTVSCPACGGVVSRPRMEKLGFAFRQCDDCRTIFMSPRPSETVLADYYRNSENYAHWAKHIFPASEGARREKIHKPWLERIVGYCDRHGVQRETLVEVGAGFGTFCSVATEARAFRQVLAVEPTPELAAACRERGVNVIEQRIEDAAAMLPGADVVCAFEVIEHLFDPGRFVADCARLLRPGGLLVVSCPNGLGFDIAALEARSSAVDAEHVNLFNPASLAILMERHGLEVVESSTPGRLDAELVRKAVLDGQYDLVGQPFLQEVLIDRWEVLGPAFQAFLAQNGLSSHLWLCARRVA